MASVLIVDDSYVMRKNLKTLLTQGGYTVAGQAVNGKEAVEAYEEHNPDYVTMDIDMPVMDGIEAVKQIKANFPDARIIMISALGDKEKVMEALKAGAKYYIIKPVTYEKVLATMERIAK